MLTAPGALSVPPKARRRDCAFDRDDFERVVWETLLNALLQFDALRPPRRSRRASTEATAQARCELGRLLDRQLFTALTHDTVPPLNRRTTLAEIKADLLAQGATALRLTPRLCDDLSIRIDAVAASAFDPVEIGEHRRENALHALRQERVLEGLLPGLDWCFVEDAGPRFHLQRVGSQERLWLEYRGQRAVEPAAPFDAEVLCLLQRRLGDEAARARLEHSWAQWMLLHGWLDVEWESERSLVLHAYPDLPGAFQRRVSLDGFSTEPRPLCPQDIGLSQESAALVLWGEREFPLSELLWAPGGRTRALRISRAPDAVIQPRLEATERARFKHTLERGLGHALLAHYRRALAEKNGYTLPHADRDEYDGDTFTSLPDVSGPDQKCAHDRRRAYAEVVVSLTEKDAVFRHGAGAHLLRDLGLKRLRRPLDRGDTAAFWTELDDALEEEWSNLGFCAEEQRKAAWRHRPQYPLNDVP
jgi:hypothetical protein